MLKCCRSRKPQQNKQQGRRNHGPCAERARGAKWSGAQIQIEQIGILSGASVMTDCEAQPGATRRHTESDLSAQSINALAWYLRAPSQKHITHTRFERLMLTERRRSLKSLRGIFALLLGDATVWYHLMDGYWYIFYITSNHVINLREKRNTTIATFFLLLLLLKGLCAALELRAKRYMRMGNAGAY